MGYEEYWAVSFSSSLKRLFIPRNDVFTRVLLGVRKNGHVSLQEATERRVGKVGRISFLVPNFPAQIPFSSLFFLSKSIFSLFLPVTKIQFSQWKYVQILLSKVLLQASLATDFDHKFRQRAVEQVKSKLTNTKSDNSCSLFTHTTKNS